MRRTSNNMYNYLELPDRISTKIMPVTESGCWIWLGSCTPGGYGKSRWMLRDQYIHRITFQFFIGPIQEGLQIDHLCRVRPCCNPYHLEQMTPFENIMSGIGFGALNKQKAHCVNGHPYSGINLRTHPNGYRRCKACHVETFKKFKLNNPTYMRDYQRAAYKKRKGGGWDEEEVNP